MNASSHPKTGVCPTSPHVCRWSLSLGCLLLRFVSGASLGFLGGIGFGLLVMGVDFESLVEATSGAVGGVVSTSILYPLDTCKTKFQAELRSGASPRYGSLLDVLREAIAKRQLLSLYQGLGTKSVQAVISQFVYFYGYSVFRQLYLRWAKVKHMGTGANLAVGVAAGACTVLITQPLDTASAQMQTSSFGKSKGLRSIMTGRTWKEAYVGIGVSLLLTCNPSIQYTVFEQTKRRMLRPDRSSTQSAEAAPVVLSAFRAFVLGAFSKTVATVLTYPAIRVKTVIQAAESEEDQEPPQQQQQQRQQQGLRPQKVFPTKLIPAAIAIWQQEGPLGFYHGLEAQILKTILGAALMLMIKEKASQVTWRVMLMLRKWSQALAKSRLNLAPMVRPVAVAGVAMASQVA